MTLTAPRRGAGDDAGTASQILDVAERLVQVRGFNGFSYADVAAELHITKAALHYHFAGKSALGEALITRYASRFAEALGPGRRLEVSAQAASSPPTRTCTCRCCATAKDVPVRHARSRVPDPATADA